MAWNFQRSTIRTLIREAVGNKGANLTSENAIIDRAVRLVASDIDLRSAKRRAALSPRVTNEYDYTIPTNLKGTSIIDLKKNTNRKVRQSSEFILHTAEEFDRLKQVYPNIFCVLNYDDQRVIRISSPQEDDRMVIHSMDGTTSNGTWTSDSTGSSANNLDTSNNEDYTGSPHLVWDVNTDTTTADIQNSTMTAVNITNFKRDGGYIFINQYIPLTSASELAKITSFRLQIGSDSSNYYQDTATTANDGTTFREGLNVLRFNFPTTANTGTPSDTAIDYVKLQLVLSSVLAANSLGWRTDQIVARQGILHLIHYYTDFLWDSGAARVASADSTSLMVYEDEADLIVEKGTQLFARALGDKERADEAKEEYKKMKAEYLLKYPSEAKILSSYYHYLGDETEDGFTDLNDT